MRRMIVAGPLRHVAVGQSIGGGLEADLTVLFVRQRVGEVLLDLALGLLVVVGSAVESHGKLCGFVNFGEGFGLDDDGALLVATRLEGVGVLHGQ